MLLGQGQEKSDMFTFRRTLVGVCLGMGMVAAALSPSRRSLSHGLEQRPRRRATSLLETR
jgi:hypothetical protein